MRFPIWIAIVTAIVALIAVLFVGQLLFNPSRPLIVTAAFDDEIISPNADGENDITRFQYEISANADVSLTFTDSTGAQYVFRQDERRIPGEYSVLFSGVVDGFTLAGEDIPGTIERRLLPNGDYTWELSAQAIDDDRVQVETGTLTIVSADVELPVISIFTISPQIFTPNQDGIDDRVNINTVLEKDVDFLRVYLLSEDGTEIPISARVEGRDEGEAGRHIFDYEGGVDLGADPPEDGLYQVFAVAQDLVGQRIVRQSELTIQAGGKPLAEIAPQAVGVDVVFTVEPYDERYYTDMTTDGDFVASPDDVAANAANDITMMIGDMLVFKLTVENYSETPIRTTYPPPGTVYQQDQRAATLRALDAAGSWRVGIECDTSTTTYPYRWALGTAETLEVETDPISGQEFLYLPPGERAVVWGAVRMTTIEERANPQDCYAGLIHEGIAVINNRVGARSVELIDPDMPVNVQPTQTP